MNLAVLLASRTVLVQLVALFFLFLAKLGLVLPTTMTPAAFVGAALLVLTTVTAVLRFHTGDDGDAKAWWQSKVIWAQLVASFVAILALFGVGATLDQAGVVETIMGAVALLNIFLAARPTAKIA